MGELIRYLKISAFRRVGGEYYFSRIMIINRNSNWEAITVNTTNRSMLARQMVDTTPVIAKGNSGNFDNPDHLINYLIEKIGFVFIFNDIEDKMID